MKIIVPARLLENRTTEMGRSQLQNCYESTMNTNLTWVAIVKFITFKGVRNFSS